MKKEEESFVILAAANQISLDAAEVAVLSENDSCWASVTINIIVMVRATSSGLFSSIVAIGNTLL